MDDVLNSPSDWPMAFSEIHELENLLRCAICFEFLRSPLMIPRCSHNYCSLCIRRHLLYKTQCPMCAQSVTEIELQPNREMGQIVNLFGSMRTRLLHAVKLAARKTAEAYVQVEKDAIPIKFHSTEVQPHSEIIIKVNRDKQFASSNFPPLSSLAASSTKPSTSVSYDFSLCNNVIDNQPSKSLESSTTYSVNKSTANDSILNAGFMFDNQSVAESFSLQRSAAKVNCPVCNVAVSDKYINIHLDRCLEKGPVAQPDECCSVEKTILKQPVFHAQPVIPKRPPMPKLVYNIMKDAEIRKKLISVGLPCHGNRTAWINRHREFTVRYNAECDAAEPKSAKEIAEDIIREEQAAKVVGKVSVSSSSVANDRDHYLKQNHNHFSQLIQDIKKRSPKKKRVDNAILSASESTGCNTNNESTAPREVINCNTDSDDDDPSWKPSFDSNFVTSKLLGGSANVVSLSASCETIGYANSSQNVLNERSMLVEERKKTLDENEADNEVYRLRNFRHRIALVEIDSNESTDIENENPEDFLSERRATHNSVVLPNKINATLFTGQDDNIGAEQNDNVLVGQNDEINARVIVAEPAATKNKTVNKKGLKGKNAQHELDKSNINVNNEGKRARGKSVKKECNENIDLEMNGKAAENCASQMSKRKRTARLSCVDLPCQKRRRAKGNNKDIALNSSPDY